MSEPYEKGERMTQIPAALLLLGILVLIAMVVGFTRIGLRRRAEANGWPAMTRGGLKASVPPLVVYQKLIIDLRGWGALWIALGALDIANAHQADPWGVMLILLGLMSFFFADDPAMYILIIVVNVWLMYRNLVAGAWLATLLGLGVGVYLAIRFGRMRRALGPAVRPAQPAGLDPLAAPFAPASPYQPAPSSTPALPADPSGPPVPFTGRSERYFPWLALGLGLAAIGGYAISYGLYFLSNQSSARAALLDVELNVTLYAALYSLGLALAALISRFRTPAASVVGLSGAGLRIMFYLVAVLPRLFERGGGPLT